MYKSVIGDRTDRNKIRILFCRISDRVGDKVVTHDKKSRLHAGARPTWLARIYE